MQCVAALVLKMDEAGCASSLTHVLLLLCTAALVPSKQRFSGAQNHCLCWGKSCKK